MPQIIYSLTAIFLLGLATLNINVKIHGSQQRMMLNELSLGMTAVGAEYLNQISKMDFDANTIFGEVLPRAALSPETAAWGTGPCNPNANFSGCFVINDFHGKNAARTLARTHNGVTTNVPYNVTGVEVHYVSEMSPFEPNGAVRSYAKRVTITVSSPVLLDNDGNPLSLTMARVYMYPSF